MLTSVASQREDAQQSSYALLRRYRASIVLKVLKSERTIYLDPEGVKEIVSYGITGDALDRAVSDLVDDKHAKLIYRGLSIKLVLVRNAESERAI
jgi:hypothetical protein